MTSSASGRLSSDAPGAHDQMACTLERRLDRATSFLIEREGRFEAELRHAAELGHEGLAQPATSAASASAVAVTGWAGDVALADGERIATLGADDISD